MKEVSKEEFEKFLNEYPGRLNHNFYMGWYQMCDADTLEEVAKVYLEYGPGEYWIREKHKMHEYIKIETPFNRDMDGTKKLIEGDFRNDTVKYLAHNMWECTEKIDGTNIGIVWDGHKVSYQGRTERAQIPAHLMNKLIEMFGGETNEELFEQKFGDMPVILFGEGYGAKIQNGGNYRQDVSFILFDVYLPENDIWLKRDSVEDIARTFGIDVVPVVLTGTLKDAIDYVKIRPHSTIGTAMMEGLVCRPTVELRDRMGRRVIVKVKVRDFT